MSKKTYYPDWTCPDCNFENFGSRSECKNCGCFRSKASSSNKSGNSATVTKKPGDWNCDCGELNFASRSACRGCNKSKPINISTGRPGDWNCDCGELNFASRSACRKCNKAKPNSSVGRVGRPEDWNCDCGELNFASRVVCRKCNKNKPTMGKICADCSNPQVDAIITTCGHSCCKGCAINMTKCPTCWMLYDPSCQLMAV